MLRGFLKQTWQSANNLVSMMSNMSHVGCSPSQSNSYEGQKLIYPAASRNKEPILQILKRVVIDQSYEISDNSPLFLEIASGSGQHLAHFAPHFPGIKFQPSEVDTGLLGSICYYANECTSKNINQPVQIDICTRLSNYGFSEKSIDYIYCANLIHISPFQCTIGLFENAGAFLKPNGLLITYGPYSVNGFISPQSNIDFDASLRARDKSWGLRDIADLQKIGKLNNLSLKEVVDMPSNNKILIWKRMDLSTMIEE